MERMEQKAPGAVPYSTMSPRIWILILLLILASISPNRVGSETNDETAAVDRQPSQPECGQSNRRNRQVSQQKAETPEEAIERQEEEVRNVERGVVGLQFAQGAMEITLGAIRIAAAGTTADVIKREDNIAVSRIALGRPGAVVPTEPTDILGPIRRDDAGIRSEGMKRVPVCPPIIHLQSVSQDPFHKWNQDFTSRIKRSPAFQPPLSNFTRDPTPPPSFIKMPDSNEAEHLLKLLENLLDINNRVLEILGIDLPPMTNSGALILSRYKERVHRRKQARMRYAMQGYFDNEEDWEAEGNKLLSGKSGPNDSSWLHSMIGKEEPMNRISDELIRLKRFRRMYEKYA